MTYSKKDITKALETISAPGEGKSLIESGAVKNIVTFDKEIIVDVTIANPSLQAKKKIEVEIMKVIHQEIDVKADVKVNVTSDTKNEPFKPEKPKVPGIQNIIAIASGKGGVGKSTITSNMAVSLQKMGFKVGILDADVYGPSTHLMFDVANARPLSIEIDGRSKMQPIESYGVKILSLGFFTDANQAVIWRGAMASKALNQMIFDAHWGDLDFLLIDLPPGTGDIHLSIVQSIPVTGAVIVSTPQNIALADAKKGVAMFKQENINVPVLGIVENMSTYVCPSCGHTEHIFGSGGGQKMCSDYHVPFLGSLPLNLSIREQADAGRPTLVSEPDGLISQTYKEIARQVAIQIALMSKDLSSKFPSIVIQNT